MADITMCANPENCPNRHDCYRAQATPSARQAYAYFYDDGECDEFVPVYTQPEN